MTAVAYPATLPNPTRLIHRPNMRAVISDLPGRPALASKERSYSGAADVEFFFNSTQAAEFYAWWNEVLARGGYWFNTSWPAVLPGLNTCQFITDPVFLHVYNGAFKISATVQVRPNSGDLSPPDPNDDLYSYVRWLFLMEGADNSQTFHEEIGGTDVAGGGNAKQVVADKPFGSSSGNFDGADDWVQTVDFAGEWNSYTQPFTFDVWVKVLDYFATENYTICSDDQSFGGAAFSLNFAINLSGIAYLGYNAGFGSTAAVSSVAIPAGVWTHVAATGDGASGARRIFINGVHTGTGTQNGTTWLSQNFYIGEMNRNFFGYKRNFNGKMKCMRCTVGVNRYPGTASFTPPNVLANYAPVP